MIELDGIQYSVDDAGTNAANIVTAINDYADANDITDKNGDRIKFEVNWANPLYMLIYGVGVLFNYLQQLVYSAGCAISVQEASERQLLNIADMANIKRKSATKTSIVGTVYSNLSSEDNPVEMTITTALTCTVPTSAGNVEFHPAFDMTVPIGSAKKIILVTDESGSFNVAANTVTAFDVAPAGFRKMVTQASAPGQEQESIASLRARIQRRTTSGTVVERCTDAISELSGVSSCNMYYNNSAVDTDIINGLEVPPRQCLLWVQGYNSAIAETYWSYMISECAGSESGDAVTQYYHTQGGQDLPVYILPPNQITPYIRVYAQNEIDDVTAQNFRDTIATLSANLTIGQLLSAGDVIKLLQNNHSSYTFTGVEMSLDGVEWSFKVSVEPYQLITLNNEYMQVLGI